MIQVSPTVRFDPVGVCIYCGATESETNLSEEHIIALSLGGNQILPKASCPTCATETARLEGYAGRQVFQDVRIQHGFPTRRPKERPTHLPLRESFSPSPKEAPIRLVPAKDYPGMLMLVNPEPAGIILGRPANWVGPSYLSIHQITGPDQVNRLKEQGIEARLYRELKPTLVLRMIIKIAMGFAVATYGLAGFRPAVRGVILGRDGNPHYWAGGTTAGMAEFPAPIGPITLHRAAVFPKEVGGLPYLAVQLQLFTYLNTPIYTVVVGHLTKAGLDKAGI
jgi:hypothetical protein